jgi:hypothetical protein
MPAAALCSNFPHISPLEYPSISYPHPALSFWMKQGACVAVEMLLPNKERNPVVLAGETLCLATASSPMVLWLLSFLHEELCPVCLRERNILWF